MLFCKSKFFAGKTFLSNIDFEHIFSPSLGGQTGGVNPMFKKNCRICNRLPNALVKALNFLPNVQKEGVEVERRFEQC